MNGGGTMRFSEAQHRQVMATSTATKIGRVDGFVVEPAPGRVTALRIGGAQRGGVLVSWSDLKAFGQDAVTLEDDGPLRLPEDAEEERRAGKDLELLGKPALLETGEDVGTVTDVEFDAATGAIGAVLTTQAQLPGAALLGIGSYAAIFSVRD